MYMCTCIRYIVEEDIKFVIRDIDITPKYSDPLQ